MEDNVSLHSIFKKENPEIRILLIIPHFVVKTKFIINENTVGLLHCFIDKHLFGIP